MNLEAPLGPSPKNSWPNPFPHWEQLTFKVRNNDDDDNDHGKGHDDSKNNNEW